MRERLVAFSSAFSSPYISSSSSSPPVDSLHPTRSPVDIAISEYIALYPISANSSCQIMCERKREMEMQQASLVSPVHCPQIVIQLGVLRRQAVSFQLRRLRHLVAMQATK